MTGIEMAKEYGFKFAPGDIVTNKAAIQGDVEHWTFMATTNIVRFIVTECALIINDGGITRQYAVLGCTANGDAQKAEKLIPECCLVASEPVKSKAIPT